MQLREKQGLLKALIGLAARLPWWLGLALALVSYVALHRLAEKPVPAALQPGQMGSFLLANLTQLLARVGQYALPFFFGVSALLSAFRRGKAERLYAAAAGQTGAIDQMSWQDFEILVGEYFRRQGFSVTDNGGGGADGGVDVVLQDGDDRFLVQCKHWRTQRVGVQSVRELYGVMAAQGVSGGFVVTSGDFTEDAVRFADGIALTLVNGNMLRHDIRAQAGSGAASASSDLSSPPDCPLCSATMVLRQARSGASAGKQFWGCSRYAKDRCRGTRELD